jgi:uncharacterized protein
MLNLQTPNVYLREVEIPPPRLLKMSVTGFVGQAERGPLNSPQLIENLGRFRDIFGDLVGYSYLPYSIFGFFLNGGERCYVVRVAHESAVKAELDQTASPFIQVQAINEGSWGNSVTVQIDPHSSRDLVLTELEEAVARNARTAKFKSVAGLAQGDAVTLTHNRDPIRERLTIEKIDLAGREVTFTEPVASEFGFPAGSAVVGRGIRLIFRFRPEGKLVREEVFDNLSMNPDSANYFVHTINGDPESEDYVLRIKNGNSILVRVQDLKKASRPAPLVEKNLQNGADDPRRITAPYFTGYEPTQEKYFRPVPPEADEATKKAIAERLNGLAAFELIDEIGLIAIPDLIIPDFYAAIDERQIPKSGVIFVRKQARSLRAADLNNFRNGQREMLKHCARMGDRSAILDSPPGAETGKGANKIEDWPTDYQMLPLARYGALYYPWIREKAADFKGLDLMLPPSAHIAGVYARTESRASVGHAPANEVLRGVVEFEFCLSDAEQAILNPRGVNCLRSFPGRGLLVWGARTMSADPAWRYVNVVRVMLATIKQILINLQWTVFEPNDRMLWDRIVATLTLFLRDLFQRGVLAGGKPEEAFFVKCDEETNPPEVIDRGEVITRVGLAPARPAEFVVVTIKRTSESVSVSEGLAGRR